MSYINYGDYEVNIPNVIGTNKKQTAGYPDRVVTLNNLQKFYVELKIFKKGTEKSTFRSFYATFPKRHKITASVPHILIGLEHDNNKQSIQKTLTGNYHIIDLYNLQTEIKTECFSNNLKVYKDE